MSMMLNMPYVKTHSLYLFALMVLMLCARANADAACSGEDKDCIEVGSWQFSLGVGLGVRTNPIVGEDNIPILLLPSISYYGEYFFWETDTIGLTLYSDEQHMVNIIGTISYDQIFFDDIGIGNFSIEGRSAAVADPSLSSSFAQQQQQLPSNDPGDDFLQDPVAAPQQRTINNVGSLHDRDIAGLAGFEYTFNSNYFSLGLQALQDVTSVHDGKQIRGAISHSFAMPKNAIELSIGAEWKDSKTLDYFYGVRSNETSNPADVYTVDDDISYYLKMDWQYRLSKKWSLRAIAHNRWFGSEVRNSPIVTEDTTLALFFGGEYHF